MTNLVSPGVQVSVIDESFYGNAGPGTVPLIVFATAANKPSPTGTGVAPGTVESQANKLYLVTSQRELIQTFGNPIFKTVQGTPVHGDELNEYGLHAAYQYLGISNRAYVMRANIDTAQLEPSVTPPMGEPINGTYWFDLSESRFGIFQSTGAPSLDPFLKQNAVIIYRESELDIATGKPNQSIGEEGDFAVVTVEATNRVFEKLGGVWHHVGSTAWKFARNQLNASAAMGTLTIGNSFSLNNITFVINTTSVSDLVADVNGQLVGTALEDKVIMSHDSQGRLRFNFAFDSTDPTQSLTLENVSGTPLTAMRFTAGTYKSVKLTYAAHNRPPSTPSDRSVAGDVWIKTTDLNYGSKYIIKFYSATTGAFVTMDAPFYESDVKANAALGSNPATGSLYVRYNPEGTSADPLAGAVLMRWGGGAWSPLSYEEDFEAPTTPPEAGTLWYNTDFKVDLMVCDYDGNQWIGYRKAYPATDPIGPHLGSAPPLFQSDDTPLVDNDLWIDTSDLENYPMIYRYTASTRKWTLVDNSDQTTPFGIVFADAREDSGGEYTNASNDYTRYSTREQDLLLSNYVDPDAPDPRTYSPGTLLFNTRFSTYNVKVWNPNLFDNGDFDENTDYFYEQYSVGFDQVIFDPVIKRGRWVTASGNKVDGSPFMGRKAQRQMIVRQLQSIIAANEDIRSELVYFNLMAVPGYPELIDEMVTLNVDQKEVAFIVGDTPARLSPDATSVQTWATNARNAPSNGDEALTTRNPYVGIYYPWGLSTNVDGMEIMVPPSTMALRTMAYNDLVSYPWFAPAGFTRGLVSNAASVGYLTAENEYQPVILNQGQRDVLYLNNINPIAYIPNRGLVVYGQKTMNPIASAMDRVNVARLTNYMRYHLDILAKPFLFEQNDMLTRDAFRITIERFLNGLVGLRALEDFAVICDESNNTAERRDRNELWADLMIKPIKSIEFIYIPIRIRNSGDSLDLIQ